MKKIILMGYMGVGKSTIAQLLSKKIHLKFVDIDQLIEQETNLSTREIFEKKGEIYFRKIEHKIFKENIENKEDLIISTGGGTPCYANNHLLLINKNVISIHLQASIDVVFERLKLEKNKRPLLVNLSDQELKEFIAKHLFERNYFYNTATFTIVTDNKNPELIVKEIIKLLN